jgi:hypothetical protein
MRLTRKPFFQVCCRGSALPRILIRYRPRRDLLQQDTQNYLQPIARGEKSSRAPVTDFRLPAPLLFGLRPKSRSQEPKMKNSPYLEEPFIPFAVALRSMPAATE